jgi:ribosomal protein S18 acetylase RimI-like enzyme
MTSSRLQIDLHPAKSKADAVAAGALGARLATMHHGWDKDRFFVVDDMAAGYGWWLDKERKSKNAVVLVAKVDGVVVGFAYGRVEGRDWNSLRERCGVGIDLFVDDKLRKKGIGEKLALALVDALKAKQVPFVILQVAWNNKNAQKFFKSLGARPTLIEMAIDVR